MMSTKHTVIVSRTLVHRPDPRRPVLTPARSHGRSHTTESSDEQAAARVALQEEQAAASLTRASAPSAAAPLPPLPPVEQGALDTYLSELGLIDCLTPLQERALAEQIANGDQEARRRFIEANLRLVVAVARRYMGRGLPLEDLIQEGNLGLLEAVRRFNVHKGYRFSSYAVWWIRQAVGRAVHRATPPIYVPMYLMERLARLRRVLGPLMQETRSQLPSADVLAQALGLSIVQVQEVLNLARQIEESCSLEQTLQGHEPALVQGERGEHALLDLLEDPGASDPEEQVLEQDRYADLHARLLEAIRQAPLTVGERRALLLRFRLLEEDPQHIIEEHQDATTPTGPTATGETEHELLTIAEVARRMRPHRAGGHLSRERARQLIESGLQKLRQDPQAQALLLPLLTDEKQCGEATEGMQTETSGRMGSPRRPRRRSA